MAAAAHAQDTMEMTINQDPLVVGGGHAKKRKKTVSYCLSVPVEKSPLGGKEVRSEKDTFLQLKTFFFLLI